jgi:hypothetical protein
MHHFFGYYDKSPWSGDFRFLLAHAADQGFSMPKSGEKCKIGIVPADGGDFHPLADSMAWNYQQGAMLQWFPKDDTKVFVFNSRQKDRFISIMQHIDQGEISRFDRPVYALHPNGKQAYSLNFSRLANLRPDYGYAGVPDPFADSHAPKEDGVFLIDLETDSSRLIVPLKVLSEFNISNSMRNTYHWVNHIQVSPNGERFAFLHRWRIKDGKHRSRLYCARADGDELSCMLDTGMVSHYDWIDENQVIVYASGERYDCYQVVDSKGSIRCEVPAAIASGDGHCTLSPNGRYILTDTYPNSYRKQILFIFDFFNPNNKYVLNSFWSCDKARGSVRCDLHPRWRQDGRQICIDSTHEGSRQMYCLNVPSFLSDHAG